MISRSYKIETMRLRAVHIASVLLLLASLGVADGSTLRDGGRSLGGQYMGVLLAQNHDTACTPDSIDHAVGEALELGVPAASRAQLRTTWTMRPPSAQCLDLHAVTGSSL
jgi:hypothetical protein